MARGFEAFHRGEGDAVLTVHGDDGEAETMPVALFFRSREEELREADREALARARGRVLDGGAGVGSMALLLQERGFQVTAVEVIPEAVGIMADRGVLDGVEGRLQDLSPTHSFDTILLLMNGAALAGTLAGLPGLLEVLEGLLAPGGQLLLDSTDLLQEDASPGAPPGHDGTGEDYPGELQYQVEFQGAKGSPFPQLFIDPRTLAQVAGEGGWDSEVVWQGEDGEYLARLTRGGGGA
jgi:SAM-dependent methyltransferase